MPQHLPMPQPLLNTSNTAPTIALFGAGGQVGSRLKVCLPALAKVVALDRAGCDLTNPAAISTVLDAIAPSIIVNAAAYTAVDQAEANSAAAEAINATAVASMAAWAAKHGAFVLHYSTDYVFDGQAAHAYSETAATNPINTYGHSKHRGELALQQAGCAYVCMRTSWVYDASGHNFMRTMLRLGAEREALAVVADQVGAPTSAWQIAEASKAIVAYVLARHPVPSGIYHFSAAGSTSWHGFADAIFNISRAYCARNNIACPLRVKETKAIKAIDYPTAAARPANSVLDNRLIGQVFAVYAANWADELEHRVAEYWQQQLAQGIVLASH